MASRLVDLKKSFLRSLRAEGRAAGTIRLYDQAVTFYCRWLESEGRPQTLDELDRAAIRAWLEYLRDQGLADNTRKTRYRGLYRFCQWLVDEDELPSNPMAKMTAPQVDTSTPVPVLSDDQLTALLKTCRGKDFADRRDQALFRVLIDCGLRVGELVNMSTEDANLDQGAALVSGKTGKRFVYFSDRTIQALDRYTRARSGHRWAHLPALWLSERGALSADGVRERFNVRCEQAGLPHVHPHQLRHTWAADFLANGGQERDAMRLAGWKSDAMLGRYGSATADARAKAAAQRLKRGDRV